MPIVAALIIGFVVGIFITYLLLMNSRSSAVVAEYEQYIQDLIEQHQDEIKRARQRSVASSRATIKGQLAEQFAPLLPQYPYLPSDSKFFGDPIDYVVFDGYTDLRDGTGHPDDIEVIFIDIKSGGARLSKGQEAIKRAIEQGRVRFETVRIDVFENG
ncbi:Holliday junction resolvase-like protein [Acinetobacter haemolyticus]|uniref:Holliday junction resolvase-like protein n=1 Tax=Acinetobacter haemolyticus TaxID=29430 RepID=UPI003F56D7FB